MTTSEYQVTGMTCGHCEAAVRGEVQKLSGVQNVVVSATDGRLIITAAEPLAESAVLEAVDEAGYSAVRL